MAVTFISDVIVIMVERPETVVVMEIVFAEFVHCLLESVRRFHTKAVAGESIRVPYPHRVSAVYASVNCVLKCCLF